MTFAPYRPPLPTDRRRRLPFTVPAELVCLEDELMADSPVALIWFDVASGNIVDAIGSRTGTANGTPTYNESITIADRTGISFDNIADYFAFTDHADYDLGDGPFTIAFYMWANNDNNNQQGVVRKGTNAYAVGIAGPGAGGNEGRIFLGKMGVAFLCFGPSVPFDGSKHMYHVTRSAAGAGNTLWYADGTESHVDSSIATTLSDTSADLEVGKDDSTLDGGLGVIAIFKSVLSQSRINAHNAAITVSCAGGTLHEQPLDVAMTMTPAIDDVLKFYRTLAVNMTLDPVVSRRVTYQKALPVSMTMTAALNKLLFKTLAASTTMTAALVRTMFVTLAVSMPMTVAMARLRAMTLAVSMTMTVAMTRVVTYRKALDVAMTMTVGFVRMLPRTLAVGMTMTAELVARRTYNVALAVNMTMAPVINRLRNVTLAVNVTMAPAIAQRRTFNINLAVGMTMTVGFVRRIGVTLAVAVPMTVAMQRGFYVDLEVLSTLSTQISTSYRTARTLAATSTLTAAVQRTVIPGGGGGGPVDTSDQYERDLILRR